MRCRASPAWSNPCWPGIADPHRRIELDPEMLFCLASLAWIDSLEQSGEAPVDCDAFVDSTDVAAGALIIRAVVV